MLTDAKHAVAYRRQLQSWIPGTTPAWSFYDAKLRAHEVLARRHAHPDFVQSVVRACAEEMRDALAQGATGRAVFDRRDLR